MSPATPADEAGTIEPSVQAIDRPVSLRIRECRLPDESRWAEFVEAHPQGMIYQHPAWVTALEEEYGRKSCTLLCEDERGQLRGVLSLLATRGLPFNWGGQTGRRLASLPRTPLAGPLALDAEAAAALLRAASRHDHVQSGLQLQIRSLDSSLADMLPGMAASLWKEVYVLDLPSEPERLRLGTRSKQRHRIKWAVNRALKLGVQIREADNEADLRAWYELYLETMRWHVSPPRPYRFLLALWDRLRPVGKLRLLLAEQRSGARAALLAGYLLLMCGSTVHCYLNGRRRDSLALHPNDLLQWQAISEACRQGYRRYDFGEVELGQRGLAEFKTKWGAVPLRSYRYCFPKPRLLPVQKTAARSIPSLAAALWRRLPLAATASLGDWIYRYL